MKLSVADAKNRLPKLIKVVEGGGSVTICRRGVPVVEIVPTKRSARKPRRLGTLKGKVRIVDPDGWKPMAPEDVEAFIEGRSRHRAFW